MNDLPFLECPERVQFSDECYSAFGRALYVAQQFESKCRALATLFTVRKAHRTGEAGDFDAPEFDTFVQELWKRQLGTNLKILQAYGVSSKIRRILHRARASRNEIAHNIGLGIENSIESDKGRKKILDELSKLVRKIAEGDSLISLLIQLTTQEPIPTAAYLKAYPDCVVKWVAETFDD